MLFFTYIYKARRECHTDCIKVENMLSNVSNDAIRLSFMNKKNGCKGKVTKVDRVKHGEELLVFVYFADFAGMLAGLQ